MLRRVMKVRQGMFCLLLSLHSHAQDPNVAQRLRCDRSLKQPLALHDRSRRPDLSDELYDLGLSMLSSAFSTRIDASLTIHKALQRSEVILKEQGFQVQYDPRRREIEFLPDESTVPGRWALAMNQAARNSGLNTQKFRVLLSPEACRPGDCLGTFDIEDGIYRFGSEVFLSLLRDSTGPGMVNFFHEVGGHFRAYLDAISGRSTRLYGHLFLNDESLPERYPSVPVSYMYNFSLDEPAAQEVSARKLMEYGRFSDALVRVDRALEMISIIREKMAEVLDDPQMDLPFVIDLKLNPKLDLSPFWLSRVLKVERELFDADRNRLLVLRKQVLAKIKAER